MFKLTMLGFALALVGLLFAQIQTVSATECTEYLCQELAVSRVSWAWIEMLGLLSAKAAIIAESPRLTNAIQVIRNSVSKEQCLGILETFEIASDSAPYILPCADTASHESGVSLAAVWVCAGLSILLFMSSIVYIYKLKDDLNKIINEHVAAKNK